jgi:preprotein translocase subunit YajC
MNLSMFFPLMAVPDAAAASGGGGIGSLVSSFVPFILIIGIFYLLIIRPQNKKQKEAQKMLANLKKGDRIITVGGIHGTIQSVKESSVIVKVDDYTKIEFSRSSISTVESGKEEKADKVEKIEDKKEEKAPDTNKDAKEESK